MIFCAIKGATAYELQIGSHRFGSVQFNWVHLSGGHFTKWRFWRRIRVYAYGPDK